MKVRVAIAVGKSHEEAVAYGFAEEMESTRSLAEGALDMASDFGLEIDSILIREIEIPPPAEVVNVKATETKGAD